LLTHKAANNSEDRACIRALVAKFGRYDGSFLATSTERTWV